MNSTPNPPPSEPLPEGGPRYASLLDQMAAWYQAQLARHPQPPTAQRRVPQAQEQAP